LPLCRLLAANCDNVVLPPVEKEEGETASQEVLSWSEQFSVAAANGKIRRRERFDRAIIRSGGRDMGVLQKQSV
jgi:hypothetical protein